MGSEMCIRDRVRRDTNERSEVSIDSLSTQISMTLNDIQATLLSRSKQRLAENTHEILSYDEFKKQLKGNKGFIKAYWCGRKECEDAIKYETKATTRCFSNEGKGKCIYCGEESTQEWLFAISY